MIRVLNAFLLLAGFVPVARAENPAALAKTVAPYLDEQTLVVVHVDVARLKPDDLAPYLTWNGAAPLKESVGQWIDTFTKAGGKDLYLIMSLADVSEGPFLIAPLADSARAGAVTEALTGANAGSLTQLLGAPAATTAQLDHALIVGQKPTLARLRAGKPHPRPDVAKAFAAAGDSVAQVLFVPTADMRRVVQEVMPNLPPTLGSAPSSIVTRGVQWAALAVNGSPNGVRLVIQSRDANSAQALGGLIGRTVGILEQLPAKLIPPDVSKFAQTLKPTLAGDQLTLTLKAEDEGVAKLIATLGARFAQEAARVRSTDNLKQLGLAMYGYHDKHASFPAVANFDKQGRPLLSWRVHLLPVLGHEALYKEFHLDEPWDSAHNKTLIERMPDVYRRAGLQPGMTGKTSYLAPVGKATIFTGMPQGIPLKAITDGTSNTIMLLDAGDDQAVIWTKPGDLKIEEKDPAAGLFGRHADGFTALFADASVRFINKSIDKKTLFALFTRNGGEMVSLP